MSIRTSVSHENGIFTYICCTIIIIIFGMLSICILPLAIPLFRVAVHRCPFCLVQIATSDICGQKLSDKVITMSCGQCAVVLSRKWILTLFVLILCGASIVLVFSMRMDVYGHSKIRYIEASWDQYL